MDVLIVRKTTNFELYGDAVKQRTDLGGVPADTFERLEDAHTEHYRVLLRLRELLVQEGLPFQEVSRDDPMPKNNYSIVITVGGDGTLLSASHKIHTGLVLGVKSSSSSVGFLCAADEISLPTWIKKIAAGDIKGAPVNRASAYVVRADGRAAFATDPVVNDFLYANSNPAATTRYRIRFGKRTETHRSSGIWVATGAGSTAAIFAAGGEQRPVDDPKLQFRVRELYKLGLSRPVIENGFFDPDGEGILIENRCESAVLAVDGQHGAHTMTYGDTISFRSAPPLHVVLRPRS